MRIVSGMMLAAALALATGCGKSDAPGEATTPLPETPNGGTPAPGTPPVAAGWEMDPAKHAIPTGAVSGKLRGEAIALEVQAERDVLRFRTVNKDGMPIGTAFEVRPSDPSKSIEGLAVTVKPDQPAGLDVPNVIVSNPSNPAEEPKILNNGYALTLSVGKREKGKVSGKVYLSVADEQKSFIAGTFAAEWIRSREELPGAEDVPFIQGKIAVTGAAEPNVDVGYIRVDPAQPILSDVLGTIIGPSGYPVRSDFYRPRCISLFPVTAAKEPARFEFTKLEPGRYWVFASAKSGPATWKWITVEANSQIVADFAIDTGSFGGLEVTAPNSTEAVSVVPASEPGKPWPEPLIATAASIMELRIDTTTASKADPTKPVTVKFPRLAPGKYEVWSGDLKVDVEVKANESAKVELKKK